MNSGGGSLPDLSMLQYQVNYSYGHTQIQDSNQQRQNNQLYLSGHQPQMQQQHFQYDLSPQLLQV